MLLESFLLFTFLFVDFNFIIGCRTRRIKSRGIHRPFDHLLHFIVVVALALFFAGALLLVVVVRRD